MTRSTTWSSRPLARISLLLAAAAVALSACSSGQVTQTAVKRPSVQGTNATVGDIAIRNAMLAFPESEKHAKGGTAQLLITLVNTGGEADTLVGVETSAARFAGLSGASPSGSASPSASATAEASAEATPSAGAPSASAEASPSGEANPSASPAPGIAVGEPNPGASVRLDLPPATLVAITASGQQIVLYDLQEDIAPGDLVEVTLRFEKAGAVTLRLPVAPPTTPLPRASAVEGVGEHAGAGEEGGH